VLETLGNPPVPTVYADPRKSGLDANRPALRHLLVDIRRGRLQRVVVRDVSRLARDATLLETILGELRAAGVDLVTIGERTGNA
jgi:DNA invertase Pin-like site-specific DNA recombinase